MIDPAPRTLFVVADPNTLVAPDDAIRSRLIANGHTVTTVSDTADEVSSVNNKDLVIIGLSVNGGRLTDKYSAVAQPVVVLNNWQNFSLSGSQSLAGSQLAIYIQNAGIAAIPAGLTTVYTAQSTIAYSPSIGAGGIIVAYQNTQPTRSIITAYPKGATLVNGSAAPGRRVALGLGNGFATLNTTGLNLFDTMIAWALGTSVSLIKFRTGGAWVDKPMKVRQSGQWL